MSKLTATTAMLMTSEEKALFRSSESKSLAKIGEAELRTQIERARHQRKKYDDLLQRERAQAQSEGAAPGSRAAKGNSKTLRKASAFTDVVTRFEAESDRRAGSITPAARSPKSTKATSKTTASSKKATSKRAPATKKKTSKSPATIVPMAGARGSKSKPSANEKFDSQKSDAHAVASEMPRGLLQNAALRAKVNELRHQRGPARRQVAHAAARGRRQQARSDSRN